MSTSQADLIHRVASSWLEKQANVPNTPRALQLYSTMPGVEKAAQSISQGLRKAKNELDRDLRNKLGNLDPDFNRDHAQKVAKLISFVFSLHVYPLLSKYQRYGAMDSEPYNTCLRYLTSVAKQFYGIRGYSTIDEFI